MKQLATAIFNRFNDSTTELSTSIDGRFYREEAPSTTSYPYIVYKFVNNNPIEGLDTQYEQFRIQFDIWSKKKSSSEIEDIYQYLKETYDWCHLMVSGYKNIYIKRDYANLSKDPDNGDWHYIVQYINVLEKE